MAKICGYIATSLDGFIVAPDNSLDWLLKYDGMDLGEHDYGLFLKRIRTVVMGRGTYDFIAEEPAPWAYGQQKQPWSSPPGQSLTRRELSKPVATSTC